MEEDHEVEEQDQEEAEHEEKDVERKCSGGNSNSRNNKEKQKLHCALILNNMMHFIFYKHFLLIGFNKMYVK